MKIIAGLGNPGVRYEKTRHNAGFMVIDKLAESLKVTFTQEKFSSLFVKTRVKDEDVILLKPLTYMNNSGFAIRQCMDFYKAAPEDLIIIYDDVDLPVGKIRLREKGSAGGHNGMKSVIHCIFTQEFPRIRVGIGRDPQIEMIDWVLSKFREEEAEELNKALENASKAAEYSITNPFSAAMNLFNKK